MVSRRQALAYRIQAQYLDRPAPKSKLAEVAEMAIQDISFESMLGALGARIKGFTRKDAEQALYGPRKSLITVHSARGASHVVPVKDVGVYTLGVLPGDEKEMSAFLGGIAGFLRKNGVSPSEAVERTEQAAIEALDNGVLTFNQLHEQFRRKLPRSHLWPCKGCKSLHVSMLQLAAAGLWGGFCYAQDRGVETTLARTDQWLGREPRMVPPEKAAAELARRFVHYYGPTTESAFATWMGVAATQARRAWAAVAPELAAVDIEGHEAFVLKKDLAKLKAAKPAKGLVLLSPHDPYLNSRDRELVVPDASLRAEVWRVVGNPGALLVDGEIRGIWRPSKKGKKLTLTLKLAPKTALSVRDKDRVKGSAEALGLLRGAEVTEVLFR